MPRTGLVRLLPGLLLALTACGPDLVAIRVTIPDEAGIETPVPGARLVVLPYDRDSILGALERQAATPRPSTSRLDSLFQSFRTPFNTFLSLSRSAERLRPARDSLRRQLDATPRDAEAYARLYAAFQSLDDSVSRQAGDLERARKALGDVRVRIQPEVDSLSARITAWEDTAFRAYDSITRSVARRRGPVTDSTLADGWVTVRVTDGRWWVYARAINIQDPNAEWYWNVPLEGDTVRLGPSNGRARPRFK
jgi:hypothetical protein